MQSVEILERLIAFPTVSRDSNLPLIDYLRDFLAGCGAELTLYPDSTGGKANLLASLGPAGAGGGVLLSGHTDVVPVDGQDWHSDPFRLQQRDGRLYGRGSADMKGFLACALAAAAAAAGRTLQAPLHLAFSHDEEVGCVGVRSMLAGLAATRLRPSLCIVGEPTLMQVANGHKGKSALRVRCRGQAAHSALAPTALNAIHLASDVIAVLRQQQTALAEHGNRDNAYDIPYSTLHVGMIQGGVALNIVPDSCQMEVEIRTIGSDQATTILAALQPALDTIVSREQPRFPEAAISLEPVNDYPGLEMPADDPAVALAQSLSGGNRLIKLAFGSEAGLFRQQLGIATVVCGPGSMDQGHKPDEYVERDQLALCDAMLARLLARLAA